MKNEIKIEGRYLLETEGGKYLCDNVRLYLKISLGFFSKRITEVSVKAKILETDNPCFAEEGMDELHLGFKDFILIKQVDEDFKLTKKL